MATVDLLPPDRPSVPAPPAPAARLDGLPAYRPGRSAADAMADHGLDSAVKLASNELPWGPLPAVADAIGRAAADAARYPDGHATTLRARLGALHGVTADRIAVGAGMSGLLQQLALAYVGPGDEVVRGEPSFEAYPIYTRLAGGRDVAVPARRWVLDVEAMGDAVGPRTRMVVVAEPNNPTGTAVGADRLRRLADRVPPSCLLVLDGAYHEFAVAAPGGEDGPPFDEAVALAAQRPNVVALRTFSKAHGLAALRVGYGVAHPEVVASLDRVLLPFAVNALGQAAALAALDVADQTAARVAAVVAERQRLAVELDGLGWPTPPSAANFVWLPTPDAVALAAGLEAAGVVTRPFAGLGVRVSAGTVADGDRFLRAMAALPAPGRAGRPAPALAPG